MAYNSKNLGTQNGLLMKMLLEFYKDNDNLLKFTSIIQGNVIRKIEPHTEGVLTESSNTPNISLRIIDWFVTNYSKKYYIVYDQPIGSMGDYRFKVYNDYKLKLKAFSKRRFDPFCRWDRITIPFDEDRSIETTIGQLNFFKWAIENRILEYIEEHYQEIESDMNLFNSASKRRKTTDNITIDGGNEKTRKKREELSISACKCIKKEIVKIMVKFN
jgi:hypothetical protein